MDLREDEEPDDVEARVAFAGVPGVDGVARVLQAEPPEDGERRHGAEVAQPALPHLERGCLRGLGRGPALLRELPCPLLGPGEAVAVLRVEVVQVAELLGDDVLHAASLAPDPVHDLEEHAAFAVLDFLDKHPMNPAFRQHYTTIIQCYTTFFVV